MPDPEVKVPAVGRVNRKWVIVGLGAVAGIVAYAYWRRQAAPAPADEGLPTDEGTGLYAGGGVDAYTGAVGGASYQPEPDQAPRTNAEWAQRAQDWLTTVGYDALFAAEALGKYLSGQPLTVAEATAVRVAKAALGPPPAGDLPFIMASTPTTGSGTPPASGKHKYVTQVHEFTVNTPVRSAVSRFSDAKVATPNNVQTATVQTQGDPRNVGDIRNGTILKQRRIYLHVVKAA